VALENRPATVEFVAPLERHELVVESTAVEAEDYVLARPALHTYGRELHELSAREWVRAVQSIVDVEGPVHINQVAKRIIDAAGVRRVGRRIRHCLEDATDRAERAGRISRRGDFLWQQGMKRPPAVRSHANVPGFVRRLDQIAPEEIMLAVATLVAHSFGMRSQDIAPAVGSLLGYGRTGEEMARQINALVESMVAGRQLVKQGEFLLVNNSR
jgi:hypothetical protein